MDRYLLRGVAALVLAAAAVLAVLAAGGDRVLDVGIVVASLVLGVVVITRVSPHYLLLALLTVGYFVGWLKLHYGSWMAYAVPDALCLLLLLSAFHRGQSRTAAPLPANGLAAGILLLTAFCLVEFVNPESPLIRSVAVFRSWLLYTWLIFAGYRMLRSPRQLQQIYVALLILSTITAAYGLYQWRQGPDALKSARTTTVAAERYAGMMQWHEEGTSQYVFRAFSTFVLPNAFGQNMAMGLLVALVLITTRGIPRWVKYLAGAGAPLMAAGIAASGTRYAAVALVLGVLVIVTLRRGRATGLILVLMGLGAWTAMGFTTSAISQRYGSILDLEETNQKWLLPLEHGLLIAAEYPLGKGMGYTAGMPSLLANAGALRDVETINVDSGIGAAAAELGFVGMLIFLLLLLQMAVAPLRAWRRLPPGRLRDLMLVPVAIALVFAMTGVMAQMAASLPYSIYMWILIGMLFRAPSLVRAPAPEEVGEPPSPRAPASPAAPPVTADLP